MRKKSRPVRPEPSQPIKLIAGLILIVICVIFVIFTKNRTFASHIPVLTKKISIADSGIGAVNSLSPLPGSESNKSTLNSITSSLAQQKRKPPADSLETPPQRSTSDDPAIREGAASRPYGFPSQDAPPPPPPPATESPADRTNRTHWDLEYRFAGGPFRLRQIRPEHAVAAGREYIAAQRARWPLPPPPPPRVSARSENGTDGAAGGEIKRIWVWGMDKRERERERGGEGGSEGGREREREREG